MSNNQNIDALAALPKEDLIELIKAMRETTRRKSNPESKIAYYSEEYGRQLLKSVIALLTDKKSRIFRYAQYTNLRPESLRLRVYYSVRYVKERLVDEIPPELREDLELVAVTRAAKGVIVSVGKSFDSIEPDILEESDTQIPDEDKEVPPPFTPKWRTLIQDYVENSQIEPDKASADPLIIKRLSMDAKEMAEARALLDTIPDIIYKINKNEIKVIKVDQDYEGTNTEISSIEQ